MTYTPKKAAEKSFSSQNQLLFLLGCYQKLSKETNMKKTILVLALIGSTLILSGCCGFRSGCCADSTPYPTSNCCGLNNGW